MLRDPVVEEARKAGEKLARQANYDIHTFFEHLREAEKKYADRLIDKVGNATRPATVTSPR